MSTGNAEASIAVARGRFARRGGTGAAAVPCSWFASNTRGSAQHCSTARRSVQERNSKNRRYSSKLEKFPRSFTCSLSCAHAQAEPFVFRVGLLAGAAYVKAMGFE